MEGNVGRMSSFNGSNWVTWKTIMEDLFFCIDLFGPIDGDCGIPVGMIDDVLYWLIRKAVCVIRQWIDDSVFHHVATETSAHDL